MRNLEETFTYDSQNRLTGVWLGSARTGASAYDGMNRLTGVALKRPSGQDLHCAVTYDALGRMTIVRPIV